MRAGILILTVMGAAGACEGQQCPDFEVFELPYSTGGQSFGINSADMDADGDADVIAPRVEFPTPLFVNNGEPDPVFEERDLSACQPGGDFMAGVTDLDGDGDLDVSATWWGGSLLWYENLGGDPVEFCTHTVREDAWGCAAADIDGDGDLDLVGASHAGGTVDWFENDGQRPPTFTRHLGAAWAEAPFYISTDDMDADGDADILTVSNTGLLSIFLNGGGGEPGFTRVDLADPPVTQVATGDLDGDGDRDIAATLTDAGGIEWLENLGGQPPEFEQHTLSHDVGWPRSVATWDMDRDGRADIVAGTVVSDELWTFRNLGGSPPAFERCVAGSFPSNGGVREIAIADLDGDADPDVVGRSRSDVFWFENPLCVADFDGDGGVDSRDMLAFLNAWAANDARADINGDGAIDTRDVLAFLNLWTAGCA